MPREPPSVRRVSDRCRTPRYSSAALPSATAPLAASAHLCVVEACTVSSLVHRVRRQADRAFPHVCPNLMIESMSRTGHEVWTGHTWGPAVAGPTIDARQDMTIDPRPDPRPHPPEPLPQPTPGTPPTNPIPQTPPPAGLRRHMFSVLGSRF